MQAVRDAFDQARESLASAATPEQFNRLVDEFVGPMVIQPDGSIAPKEMTLVEDQSHLQSCIAGGRYDTERAIISAVLWAGTQGVVRLPR